MFEAVNRFRRHAHNSCVVILRGNYECQVSAHWKCFFFSFSQSEIVILSVSKLYRKDPTVKVLVSCQNFVRCKLLLEEHCRNVSWREELAKGHCPQDFIFKTADYYSLDEGGLKARPVLPAKPRILLQQWRQLLSDPSCKVRGTISSKDNIIATAGESQLLAETVYWTNSKTFGK